MSDPISANRTSNSPSALQAAARFSSRDLAQVGMFAAVLAVISQISLPMPTGVPITIQVFGITLVGIMLGSRRAVAAVLVYVLIGAVGMPVFAGFQGGVHILIGLTGGYIWSWPLMAALSGIRPKLHSKTGNMAAVMALSLFGLALNEIAGCLQWAALSGSMSVNAVFLYALTAFIPKDIILTVLAVLLGSQMKKMLNRW